jgi:multiple sugar transport system permease protein
MSGRRSVYGGTVIYGLLFLGMFVAIFPVLWTVLTSLKPGLATFAIPPVWAFRPTLEHYQALFGGRQETGYRVANIDFWFYMKNSLIAAIGGTLLTLVAASMAAYSLSRFYFKGKRLLTFAIVSTRMLPPIGTIVPLFLFMHKVGLLDTHAALVLAYTAFNLPLAVWMLRGFMDEVPKEVDEAAMIDGCSRLGVLGRIVMPMAAPGIGATAVLSFLLCWNDFTIALLLTNREATTLPVIVLSFISDEGIMWGPMTAAVTCAMVPMILVVIFAQKWMGKGLTFGAVKG